MERRALLAGLAAALLGAGARAEEEPPPRVIVVSRAEVLRETVAGRALRKAEQELTAAFQERVEAVKREIEAEEEELARLRGELGRAEFERRAAAFDRKVRIARRRSQRHAAELQQSFRTAREQLTAELVPILIEVLRSEGASVVLDADQVLIAAPSVNMTEKVIALFDERVETPEIPALELGRLLPTPEEVERSLDPEGDGG